MLGFEKSAPIETSQTVSNTSVVELLNDKKRNKRSLHAMVISCFDVVLDCMIVHPINVSVD